MSSDKLKTTGPEEFSINHDQEAQDHSKEYDIEKQYDDDAFDQFRLKTHSLEDPETCLVDFEDLNSEENFRSREGGLSHQDAISQDKGENYEDIFSKDWTDIKVILEKPEPEPSDTASKKYVQNMVRKIDAGAGYDRSNSYTGPNNLSDARAATVGVNVSKIINTKFNN